jgi:hypothetical protein
LLHYGTAVAAWWVVNLLQQHSNLFSSLFPPSIHFKKSTTLRIHFSKTFITELKKFMYLYLHLDWWELMEASGLSWQLVTALHDEGEGLKTAIDFFFHL